MFVYANLSSDFFFFYCLQVVRSAWGFRTFKFRAPGAIRWPMLSSSNYTLPGTKYEIIKYSKGNLKIAWQALSYYDDCKKLTREKVTSKKVITNEYFLFTMIMILMLYTNQIFCLSLIGAYTSRFKYVFTNYLSIYELLEQNKCK